MSHGICGNPENNGVLHTEKEMKILSIIFLLLLPLTSNAQTGALEYRSIDYYFEQIADLELAKLLEEKVLLDSTTIADAYLDKKTNRLNEEGFHKYAGIKMNIYRSFFKDCLYQQHLEYEEHVFVLYFTMTGFDDMEWNVVKWTKQDWNNEERLDREKLENDGSLSKVIFNYDEGPKNLENSRIFIEKEYLVLERGNLYHSLYDLDADSLLINEESPWHLAGGQGKEEMNEWIKTNLHDEIEKVIGGK